MEAAQDMNWLQKEARSWALKVVALHRMQVPPDMEAGKQALLSTAKTVKETVEKVAGPIDALQPMNELGFIPVLVGAVAIAAAGAAITKWTLDYQKFAERVKARNDLIKGGMTPAQAIKMVPVEGAGWSDNAATISKYALGAAALFLVAKYLRVI